MILQIEVISDRILYILYLPSCIPNTKLSRSIFEAFIAKDSNGLRWSR